MNRLHDLYTRLERLEVVSYDHDIEAVIQVGSLLVPTPVDELLTLAGPGEQLRVIALDSGRTLVSYSGIQREQMLGTLESLRLRSRPYLQGDTEWRMFNALLQSDTERRVFNALLQGDTERRVFNTLRAQLQEGCTDRPVLVQQEIPAGLEGALLPVLRRLAEQYAASSQDSEYN